VLANLLWAFGHSFSVGVLAITLVDLLYLPMQAEGGTDYVHVGGGGLSDAIFLAGYNGAVWTMVVGCVVLVLRAVQKGTDAESGTANTRG
jgi:hypothetical protein